ncbi:MAG: prephenate dehydrogenase/arogenate dehydrogenase family protein [Candidatus Acidiferrales bacterium]|jgi:prephenate dehydrogenase
MAAGFKRVAILGTGLIGGSFGLALRRLRPRPRVVGWDKPETLRLARKRGAIDRGEANLARAVRGADLVYIALPVGAVLEHLPEIARAASPHALVTDTASSKRAICERAAECFTGRALFLGGHPMAGKEISGVAAAEAKLFAGARYALIRASETTDNDPRVLAFVALLGKLGAQPLWLDAASHDRAAAFVSHLPQLLAVALAGVVRDQTDQTGLPLILAGRGLRESLRLAGSPYALWRDIVLTNADNIDRALDRMAQAIENLRPLLRSRELEDEFAGAGELYKILRDSQ